METIRAISPITLGFQDTALIELDAGFDMYVIGSAYLSNRFLHLVQYGRGGRPNFAKSSSGANLSRFILSKDATGVSLSKRDGAIYVVDTLMSQLS